MLSCCLIKSSFKYKPGLRSALQNTSERFTLYFCYNWRFSLGKESRMNYSQWFCVPKTLKMAFHHRKSWIFPDHFIIRSHTQAKKQQRIKMYMSSFSTRKKCTATWCPYATREQRIPIWACASVQPDLDFAFCWRKKAQKWEKCPYPTRE